MGREGVPFAGDIRGRTAHSCGHMRGVLFHDATRSLKSGRLLVAHGCDFEHPIAIDQEPGFPRVNSIDYFEVIITTALAHWEHQACIAGFMSTFTNIVLQKRFRGDKPDAWASL